MTKPGRWERLSLRHRIVLGSAAVLGPALLLAVLTFTTLLDANLYSATSSNARTRALQVTALMRDGGISAEEAVRELSSPVSHIQVLSAEGTVIAASGPEVANAPLLRDLPRQGDTVSRRVERKTEGGQEQEYAMAAYGDAHQGSRYTVVVELPLDVVNRTVRFASSFFAGVSALLLLFIAAGISAIVTRSLRQVDLLRGEVDRIQGVQSADRVTVPAWNDEISRLAETMNRMLDRLDRADRTTRQFISDASHELRSPLATMRAGLETAPAGRAGGGEALVERDAMMAGEVLRMQRLVEDLLTLAKADDGGLVLRREEVDLDDILDAEVRRVRTTTDVPVKASIEAARVWGDPARLEQLVRNLVENAQRHTSRGVSMSVETRLVAGRPTAVLLVDNDGPPVPVEDRERVFDRFVRLQAARDRDAGGSGLGLAIVRTIAQAHGGSASTGENEQGRCRFEVRLPAGEEGDPS